MILNEIIEFMKRTQQEKYNNFTFLFFLYEINGYL